MESLPTLQDNLSGKPQKLSGPNIVRPELNLEKWPALWEPARSRRIFKTRIIERKISRDDGSTVTARIRIAPSTEGTLTTEEQRHLYGLIRIWEDSGKPVDKVTHFSLQRLGRVLKKRWGSRTIETMTESLTRLLSTTIFWENAYFDRGTGETKNELHGFHILEELYIAQTSRGGHVTTETCYFRFNTFILNNLLANYTKPVLLDTVLSFQSEIAQILYTYLDLILSNKEFYRRRTKELFEELGLDGAAYRNVSDRKRTLERVIKELERVPLTTGYISSISLARTVDSKDYNLVVRKDRTLPKAVAEEPEPVATAIVVKNEAPDEVPAERTLAIEQVRFFYEHFFQSGAKAIPSEKEISHAADHLERYGVEGAKHLITFARREAPKTKFDIQNYGGICVYEARAVKDFEKKKNKKQEGQEKQSREKHQEQFYSNYLDYVRQQMAQIESTNPGALVTFLDYDNEAREKYVRQRLTIYLKTVFDTEKDRLARFAHFFHNHPECPVFDFWEWDTHCNTDKFGERQG